MYVPRKVKLLFTSSKSAIETGSVLLFSASLQSESPIAFSFFNVLSNVTDSAVSPLSVNLELLFELEWHEQKKTINSNKNL